jgi:hypothetical protein
MKFEVQTLTSDSNSAVDPNPDNITIDSLNFSNVSSSHDYIPFYALHKGSVKRRNVQLIREEIRILEQRLKELKEKLIQLQKHI